MSSVRRLGAVLLVLLLALMSSKWWITSRIEGRIEELVRSVAMFGDLKYQRLSLNWQGQLSLDYLTFESRIDESSARINHIGVDMGSLWHFAELAMSRRPVPDTLSLSVQDLVVDLPSLGTNLRAEVDCLDWQAQPPLWMLGFSDDSMDVEIGYNYDPRSQLLDARLSLQAGSAYEFDWSAIVSALPGLSAGLLASPELAADIKLEKVSLDYQDINYTEKWLNFCADHHQFTQAELLRRHILHINQQLSEFGYGLSEPLDEAYRRFLEVPGRVKIDWQLNRPLLELQTVNSVAELLPGLSLELQGKPVEPLFKSADYQAVERDLAEIKAKQDYLASLEYDPTTKQMVEPIRELSFAELPDFIDKTITVHTPKRVVNGVLYEVKKHNIRIHMLLERGTMDASLHRNNITKITTYRAAAPGLK